MAKRDLSTLLGSSLDAVSVGPDDRESSGGTPDTEPRSATEQGRTGGRNTQVDESGADAQAPAARPRRRQAVARTTTHTGGPRYLEFDRKELRIRGDQADDLTTLTRQLNRARKSQGERITDNTLIRVAIDLLMRERNKLRGTTEADLLKSVLPD
jgi:hypothetical protein